MERLLPVGNGSLGVTGCHPCGRAIRVGLSECGIEFDGLRPVRDLTLEIAEVRSGPAAAVVSGRVLWIALDRSREALHGPGEVASLFQAAAFKDDAFDVGLERALLKDR